MNCKLSDKSRGVMYGYSTFHSFLLNFFFGVVFNARNKSKIVSPTPYTI